MSVKREWGGVARIGVGSSGGQRGLEILSVTGAERDGWREVGEARGELCRPFKGVWT